MVTTPVRATPVFAATLNDTEPMPDPVAPLVTVIHSTLLVALHAHCVPLMMLTVRLVLADPIANVVGVRL